jgi:hypothetical protein
LDERGIGLHRLPSPVEVGSKYQCVCG